MQSSVQQHTGVFRFGEQDITFHFWLVPRSSAPDTVIFLGAGQVGRIPRWVAQAAGPGVVVVDGLPHWFARGDGSDTEDFSRRFVQTAFQTVCKAFGVGSLHVIGDSQAAPACIILARRQPEHVNNLVLIRPLGFTVQAFGNSEQARLRTFRRRIRQTSRQFSQSLLHDPRNAGIAAIMIRAMLREPSLAALNKKYAIGISYDLIEDCRAVAAAWRRKGHTLTLLLGKNDKMFPPAEIIASLQAAAIAGVDLETLPGVAHSSLAVRASRSILRRALQTVRNVI